MRVRLALSTVVLGAAVAGCSTSTPEASPTTTTTAPSITVEVTEPPTTTTTEPVVLPEPVPVVWSGCGAPFECARLVVPVDYRDPAAGTLELALVKRPAGDRSQRIGTLLLNPGGPGASGVRRVERGFRLSDEVAARFDIVGFDPRGIGQSTPISCGATVPAFRALDLAPDAPGEDAILEAAARAVADECSATEGGRLGHFGTVEVAHDVEVIRRALGEAQVSFVGLSYGTFIGQLWADRYPTSVRAMVLDGVVDPGAGSALGSAEQAEGVDDAVDAMAAACALAPSCPVSPAGGLLAGYDELARRIEAGAVRSLGVGPTQLAYAAFYATYDADTWPRLWEAVASGLEGDLTGVAALADSYTSLVPYAPFAIVTCLDGVHSAGYAAWQVEGERFAQASPRFGRVLANELLPCAFWPAATYTPAVVEATGTPPILVIGSTGDAATPYEAAVRVASNLIDGALLTVELSGHVALGDSACASERATRYLVDLAVPEPGARC